jgi:hypothetical protein
MASKKTQKKTQKTKKTQNGNAADQAMAEAQGVSDTSTLVGHMVYWDLKNCQGDRAELISSLTEMGEHDLFPENLGPEERVRYVKPEVEKLYKGLLSIDILERVTVPNGGSETVTSKDKEGNETTEEVPTTDGLTIYQPVLKSRKKTKKEFEGCVSTIKGESKSRISLNRDRNSIAVEDGGEIGTQLKEAFEAVEGQFLRQEIQAFLRRFVTSLKGLPFRGKGGFYWVPSSPENDRRLKEMKSLVSTMGLSRLQCNEMTGNSWKVTAGDIAETSVASPLSTMLQEVSAYVDTMETGDLVQPRALAEKVKQCKNLVGQMDLYREVLADRSAGMYQAMGVLKTMAKEMMEGSAEVRVLQRTAKKANSKDLDEFAANKVRTLAESTRKSLSEALSHYSPSEDTEEAE